MAILQQSEREQQEQLVLRTIRCLVADVVQQFKGGHPGTAMGAAAISVSLWRDVMRFNPKDGLWFNRDRFVLSAGHACLFQYIALHLVGYDVWTLNEIKRYHSRDFQTSRAAGHPEMEQEAGIEVTTGPLGQGLANSVGLAIAGKQLAARYNKPGFEGVIDNTIWCFTGDGCTQEGVGQEAISMAGHFALDNLVLIYDANKVTVDGSIDECYTEDIPLRFKAAKWNVLHYPSEFSPDDISAVTQILLRAKKESKEKRQPTIVIIPTVIGFGSLKEGQAPTHGAALGQDDVDQVKRRFGFQPEEKFVVSKEVYEHFEHVTTRNAKIQEEWEELFVRYGKEYPEEHAELVRRIKGELPAGWEELIAKKEELDVKGEPTRKSSGRVVKRLAPVLSEVIAGSADLMESTFVGPWDDMEMFQNPETKLGTYNGRQIRYGIREFGMAAVANGMAAYFPKPGGFLPVYSSFFMFMCYALPAIRMAALMGLRTIAISTHDSIGIGEDGPTHQPISLPTFFRSLPNSRLWRPADAEEVMAAWTDAMTWTERTYHMGHQIEKAGPTLICLSRQAVPLLKGSDRQKAKSRGAYTVWGDESQDVRLVLVATGSEVSRAVEVAERLEDENVGGLKGHIRVVSAPCLEVFNTQEKEYRMSMLPSKTTLVVSIEAWTSFGWARYAHASCSMTTFGHSGPQADLYTHFGFGVKNLVKVVGGFVKRWEGRVPGVGEFEELLGGFVPGSTDD
ncbi:transketolase [Marasmius fiardii PR-910]|nr:transketolase [Marasmius fiardii PR-910]